MPNDTSKEPLPKIGKTVLSWSTNSEALILCSKDLFEFPKTPETQKTGNKYNNEDQCLVKEEMSSASSCTALLQKTRVL